MKIVVSKKIFASAFIITLLSIGTMSCSAHCPIDQPCPNNGALKQEIPPHQYFAYPQDKFQTEQKAEFEARLNLTKKQQEKLEKIKAEEQKELAPLKRKFKKLMTNYMNLCPKNNQSDKTVLKNLNPFLTKSKKPNSKK